MNKPLFKESDFPLEGKVMRYLAENFTEKRKITIRREELEEIIGENLTSRKVGSLIQGLKKFGIKTTSEITYSHNDDEKLTFVVVKPNIEKLLKSRQRVQGETSTPIIIA